MIKKLLKSLQDKCKDFGLTDNAIEDLAETGSEGLTDDSSDEDIEKKANSLVPFAKAMQGEITRKAQKKVVKPSKKNQPEVDDEDDDTKKNDVNEPDWFKAYKAENQKQLDELKGQNEALKAEKAKSERRAAISSKAKELGIPDFLMKRFSIADDADVTKELTEYKQDLVTNKLMPADKADILSSAEKEVAEDAKSWAKTLPDK